MHPTPRIQLKKSPSILGLYRRALFAKGSKKPNPTLPKTQITLRDTLSDPKKIAQYKEVCGFKEDNGNLPLTFPHIIAFPIHLELMLSKGFPFALLGMVHIRNEITQYRAIKTHEIMDICCSFSDLRTTDKGYDVDIKTEVYIAGELVWESVSTNLIRQKTGVAAQPKSVNQEAEDNTALKTETWSLASNLGRRYALVSGDSNPIHLLKLSAKLFGFKGHIAHGMWTKARVAATLYNQLDSEACKIKVDFKLPIFLPGKIQLQYQNADDEITFDVKDEQGIKPHLKGSIVKL